MSQAIQCDFTKVFYTTEQDKLQKYKLFKYDKKQDICPELYEKIVSLLFPTKIISLNKKSKVSKYDRYDLKDVEELINMYTQTGLKINTAKKYAYEILKGNMPDPRKKPRTKLTKKEIEQKRYAQKKVKEKIELTKHHIQLQKDNNYMKQVNQEEKRFAIDCTYCGTKTTNKELCDKCVKNLNKKESRIE